MKKSYSAYEIEKAFVKVRELLAIEYGVDYANGKTFSIEDVKRMVMDVLQPPEMVAVSKKAEVKELKDVSLDAFNDALFG